MPDIDVVAVTKAALELLMEQAKAFYEGEGQEMLEEDRALIEELAKDSAKATYKLAVAKVANDEAKMAVYQRDLQYIAGTLRLRLMRRELQLAEEARERLESLLGDVVAALIKTVPTLLSALL